MSRNLSKNLSDYRIVNPLTSNFSASEARASWTSIRFNNLSAAELGYPEYVRLLISQDGNTLAIQGCASDDPCAVPFMHGRPPEEIREKKKWLSICNRMLLRIIREKQHWGDEKVQRRFYGIPWNDQGAILFDLTRIVPYRSHTPNYTPDEMLQTYSLAAQTSFVPVVLGTGNGSAYRPFSPESGSFTPGYVDADYAVVNE